ncbi:MAG TPA: EutN/CcmL family microcompartment protein [Rectinemataceae bacterium]|nr:EutN/CcmL family microcompartment protein [Rectinemataceae bacterium]
MRICRVIGKAQATVKHQSLEGTRLLVLRDLEAKAGSAGAPFLAVDAVGAGEGETVAVCTGGAAARAIGLREAPVDAVVVGILDTITIEGEERK